MISGGLVCSPRVWAQGSDLVELEPIEVSSTLQDSDCELGWNTCSSEQHSGGRKDASLEKVRNSSPGGLGTQISLETNITVSTSGQPGSRASLIGLGRSAEETDVRALGISLSPPQGGGFDLSSFPSTFWSSYSPGISSSSRVNAFRDPRAPSGVLELMPWTAASLLQPETEASTFSVFQNASSLSVFESAVGFTTADRSVATWAAYSSGLIQGPSAALSWMSGKSSRREQGVWDAHILFSDLNSQSPGSESFPTPGATQRSSRVIPILGWQRRTTPAGWTALRAFADFGMIDYQAPSIDFASVDRSSRLGMSLSQEFPVAPHFGVSLERSQLQQTSLTDIQEWTAMGWIKRPLSLTDRLRIEPRVQLLWISGLASRGGPLADVDVRHRLEGPFNELHFNLSSAIRAPSLLNRFYESPIFNGNPELGAERVWSARLGTSGSFWRAAAFAEVRQNALITTGVTRPYNSGTARLAGAELSAQRELDQMGRWSVQQSLRFTQSRVDDGGAPFPLVPDWSAQGGIRWRGGAAWSSALSFRAVSSFATGLGSQLEGFSLWNFEITSQMTPVRLPLRASFRVENILAQKAYWIPDYPVPGRVFSVALTSELE
jgi:hypothetical protein